MRQGTSRPEFTNPSGRTVYGWMKQEKSQTVLLRQKLMLIQRRIGREPGWATKTLRLAGLQMG